MFWAVFQKLDGSKQKLVIKTTNIINFHPKKCDQQEKMNQRC